ncbi:MAG: PadR family transcriptional regulator [Cellulomonadaceae bacterium]|jgi:DNA-binding PadR family transcriptional regulator|nr:PadR family transcriptional regulator [Cellulomonadaceae bacterium]
MTVPMAILAFLDAGPAHGFELKSRYDDLLGQERELKYGQVYATLARLEKAGLATELGLAPGAGQDRRMYAITPAGVSEFEQWLSTPDSVASRPAEVFTRVVLALACGRDAEQVLAVHRRAFLHRMRDITARRHAAHPIERLAGDYEIAHLKADLEWIELAAKRLGVIGSQVQQSEKPQSEKPAHPKHHHHKPGDNIRKGIN